MLEQARGTGDLDWGSTRSGRSGAGYDPLTSVLEGLGHSPEASTKFFNDEVPTVYNDDGTVKKNATLDYNYFDELTDKDFEWPADTLSLPAATRPRRPAVSARTPSATPSSRRQQAIRMARTLRSCTATRTLPRS